MDQLKRTVVMSDLNEPEASLIRSAAYRSGFRVEEVSGKLPPVCDPSGFALNVVGQTTGEEDLLDRVSMLQEALPEVATVVVTPPIAGTTAFRLAQLGARELVTSPLHDPQMVLRHAGIDSAAVPLDAEDSAMPEIVGHSPAMATLRKRIRQVGPTDSTVLLTGETGTGKGLAARALHRLSSRNDHAFVHVDCASLSPTMIESELFGHERGAFTGAVARRSGRFELARSGTIFLDEIGELDTALQTKFLRVLEDREFERIGDSRTQRMTARVVAATNRNLESDVQSGRVRADLYFRLNVFQIRLPPLRERGMDIPAMAQALLARKAEELRLPCPQLSPQFCDRAMQHSWPGNVRELGNVMERLLISNTSQRLDAHVLEEVLDDMAPMDLRLNGDIASNAGEFRGQPHPPDERSHIAAELLATGGNVARVARRLDMPRSTLRYKIRRYELGSMLPSD